MTKLPRGVIPLAKTVKPVPGEAFDSLVDRAAAEHGMALGSIEQLLGAERWRTARQWPAVDSDVTSMFSELTRLDEHDVHRTLLSSLVPPRPSSGRARSFPVGAMNDRSRACPDCLAADGAWRLSWRLGVSFCCSTHRTTLTSRCTSCRQDHRARPATGQLGIPGRCVNLWGGTRRPCLGPLNVDRPKVTAAAAAAQASIDAAVLGAPPAAAGRTVTGGEFVECVQFTVGVITAAWRSGRKDRLNRVRFHKPRVLNHAVPLAVEALSSTDSESAARTVASYASVIDRAGHATWMTEFVNDDWTGARWLADAVHGIRTQGGKGTKKYYWRNLDEPPLPAEMQVALGRDVANPVVDQRLAFR